MLVVIYFFLKIIAVEVLCKSHSSKTEMFQEECPSSTSNWAFTAEIESKWATN